MGRTKALPWELRQRGLKDSIRHDQRVKDAIRRNLRELISEEAIITSDGQKTVKIPLRYLEQYRFKYGQPPQGVGQGTGNPGDVLGRRSGDGQQPGGMPGDQPGDLTYDAEVPLEELTQMMLEDMALPWLEERPQRIITSTTYEHRDRRRHGSLANLDKRRTAYENVKRNAARGDPSFHGIKDDDLRFKVWEEHHEYQANAAVYMLMDRSGSMTTSKKYIAKSFFFWMVRFLRRKYRSVATVFIAHDTEAQVVPEKNFFGLSNDGGTRCSSAYEVARRHILAEYPPAAWNVYLFHFSDGDNLPFDNATCKSLVEQLIDMGCRMVGYGEICHNDDASFYGWTGGTPGLTLSSLQEALKPIASPRFLYTTITHKEELYETLQKFLTPAPQAAPIAAMATADASND